MIFHSFNYILIFLPITLIVFRSIKNRLYRNLFITISSYFFYGLGNPFLCLLLFFSSSIDFCIGKKIYLTNLKIDESLKTYEISDLEIKKKILLLASLSFNIGLLFFFKYWDWFLDQSTYYFMKYEIISINLNFLKHHISVPPGISFYTFQTLSYTIDIFRRKLVPENKIVDYFAFVAFFPQLIAGPIERAKDILPQLNKSTKKLSLRIIDKSFFFISWGLFKKLVFADNLGHLVSRCMENINIPGVGLILLIAFSFQIYCDFSAYTDIARGTANLFGIKIKRNFLTPYFAINPSDFWQRWHISLSQWVKDYIYIPLGGNKCSKRRNVFNLLLTMTLMGLWHGASKYFIIWGFYQGMLLVLYRIIPIDKILINNLGRFLGSLFSKLIMYSFNLIGWLFFFSRHTSNFIAIFKSLISTFSLFTSHMQSIEVTNTLLYGLIIYISPIIISDFIGYKYNNEFVDIGALQIYPVKVILYIMIFYGILIFGSRGSYDFIYFQF